MEQKDTLSRLREQRGLTQQEVAEELGVSRQAVSQWEAGKTFPSMEKQLALSRLYGVSLEELYRDGAAQDKEVEPEAAPEEAPPIAGDAPEMSGPKAELSRKGKRIIMIALAACVYCGTLLWGKLASSLAMATGYLIWETIFLAAGLTIKLIWRNRKK